MSASRLLPALFVGLVVLAACFALPGVAQSAATDLSGHVLYGSGPSGNVEGLTVTLQELDNTGNEVGTQNTVSAPDGGFVFKGVTPSPGRLYRVAVEFAQVRYYGDGYLAEEVAGKTLDIKVYETTTSPDHIKIARQTTVIVQADQAAGMLRILENTTLENTGTLTFIGQQDESGQTVTTMIPLPPLSIDVQPGYGFSDQGFLETQGAIADVQPLPPGRREMIYSYSVAYLASETSFGRAYSYPVDEVQVLVPTGAMKIAPDGLNKGEQVVISKTTYESFTAKNIEPGTRVGVLIQDLPTSQGSRSRSLVEILRWAALGVAALGLCVVIGFYVWHRRTRLAQAEVVASVTSPRAILVERLAEVEEAHRAGRLSDQEYQKQRAQIREGLQDILAGEGG